MACLFPGPSLLLSSGGPSEAFPARAGSPLFPGRGAVNMPPHLCMPETDVPPAARERRVGPSVWGVSPRLPSCCVLRPAASRFSGPDGSIFSVRRRDSLKKPFSRKAGVFMPVSLPFCVVGSKKGQPPQRLPKEVRIWSVQCPVPCYSLWPKVSSGFRDLISSSRSLIVSSTSVRAAVSTGECM